MCLTSFQIWIQWLRSRGNSVIRGLTPKYDHIFLTLLITCLQPALFWHQNIFVGTPLHWEEKRRFVAPNLSSLH